MAIARRANVTCAHGPGCPHDIGEAAGSVDGLSALGRLSALRLPDLGVAAFAMGAGPITRRQATAEELAAVAARDGTPSGASAIQRRWNGQVATHATPSRPEEEPMPAAISETDASQELQLRYVAALIEMLSTANNAAESELMDRIERLLGLVGAPSPDAAPEPIRRLPSDAERMQASRQRGAAARVAQVREAQAVRHPSTASEREEKAERAAAVIAAIGRHGGDKRAAAAELGMKLNGLLQIEKHAHRQLVAS